EVTVNRRAVLSVVCRVLQQHHADSHLHCALDLITSGQRINNPSCIDHCDDAIDAQSCDLRLPRDFDKMAAKRMRGKLRLWVTERRLGRTVAANELDVGPF